MGGRIRLGTGSLVGAGALFALPLVSACGSSAGGIASTPPPPPVATPTPSPTPTPTPTPTPSPTPTPAINFDTAEYRATVGAVSANALVAYQRGAIGTGIRVGIIDSGIDTTSAEFGNRIDPASAAFAGNSTIQDDGGHGTAVAFTIAGRRNDAGSHGIAFDSTLLVFRTNEPGSCSTTGTNGGCSHDDRNIAAALDAAVTNRARVVNISLGGVGISSTMTAAVNRATAAGVIIVISAGNSGAAQVSSFAQIAENAAVSRGLVIVAGSVGSGDAISDFSNRAGTTANAFLAAVGERVRAPDNNNVAFLWSGTSFSAPQVTGAVALLAQAFPTLTGAQIVDILYRTARDVGAAGVDAVYGRGILDLTRAFAPLGATSVAGTSATVSLVSNGSLSAPMGDASRSGLGAVILDSYGRAYGVDLARTLSAAALERPLSGALALRQRQVNVRAGDLAIAVTIAPGRDAPLIERTLLSPGDAEQARTLAASVVGKLGSRAQFAIGFSQSAAGLGAQLAGRSDPAFLIARAPDQGLGFASTATGAAAVRQRLGGWGLAIAAENGNVISPDQNDLAVLRNRAIRFGYDQLSLGIDRRFGALSAAFTASWLNERDTILGARFGDGIGGGRATSWFVDANARFEAGNGWAFGASYRQGWTQADLRSGLTGAGLIQTNAFAADLGKRGVFGSGDTLGLRVSQPLRVAAGGIDFTLPSFFDYGAGRVSAFTSQRFNLTPTGREIDVELGYARHLFTGNLQTNFYWRRNPGNLASLADDYGLAMRYSIGF